MGPGKVKMAPDNGAFLNNVHRQIECARILQEHGLVFQFSGLSTSGSFNCDKKVLYFDQKGLSEVCVQTLVCGDKALILHCVENFDQSTGKM